MVKQGDRIYINTIDKLNQSDLASNCLVNFAESFRGNSLQIDEIILWNLFYPFASYNNTLTATLDDGGDETYSITIPTNKFYKPSELADELKTLMNAKKNTPSDWVSSITYDSQTGKLTFNFNYDTQFDSEGTTAQYKLGIFGNLDQAKASSITANLPLQQNTKQVYIQLPGLASGQSANTSNTVKNSIACVPIDADFTNIIVYKPTTPIIVHLDPNKNNTEATVTITNSRNQIKNYYGEMTIAMTLL